VLVDDVSDVVEVSDVVDVSVSEEEEEEELLLQLTNDRRTRGVITLIYFS
jgi:riboflavin synthase